MAALKIIGRLSILAILVPLAIVAAWVLSWVLVAVVLIYLAICLARFLADDEAWRSIRLFLSGQSNETEWGKKMLRQLEERAR